MSFDAAKHFNTLPELVSRTYNRPRLETLRSQPVTSGFDEKALKVLRVVSVNFELSDLCELSLIQQCMCKFELFLVIHDKLKILKMFL